MAGIGIDLTHEPTGIRVRYFTPPVSPTRVVCGYCGRTNNKVGTASRDVGDAVEEADICIACVRDHEDHLDRFVAAFPPQRRTPK
jgi:hypothetical protein